jgi:hypothetical protein
MFPMPPRLCAIMRRPQFVNICPQPFPRAPVAPPDPGNVYLCAGFANAVRALLTICGEYAGPLRRPHNEGYFSPEPTPKGLSTSPPSSPSFA